MTLHHSDFPSARWIFDTISPILSSLLSVILIGASFLFHLAFLQISRYLNPLRKLPYPPGPPPRDWILGNARDLLAEPLWLTVTDWAATYGNIVHIRALDKHMIVLSSIDDAIELMDKRSNNYSDRPYVAMVDLTGGTFFTSLMPYGSAWHAHRRIFQQLFRPTASLIYRLIQVEKVNDMLYNLLDSPEDFIAHSKTLSVSVIMSMMYGYKVSPKQDNFRDLIDEAMTAFSDVVYPGASIVNVLPFLRFLPTWFPGANFHHIARTVKGMLDGVREVPYKYVQDNLAAGTGSPSFVADLLETCKSEEDHTVLKEVAATGYSAGADTTATAIITFIHAMAKYPNVQKKAQEELDRVVGTDRLPHYDDETSLPYIQAVFREVLRWRPVVPLAVFHATSAEDVYKGYYIPEGTAIIPNVWAMTRNPLKYKNPEEFNPDRFFDENNKLNSDDMMYIFGFGRRICPGRHMAAATVWLAITSILATFDIRPPKDASGNDLPVNVKYNGALVSQALPFKCIINPRSIKAKELIVDIQNTTI